MDNKFVEVAAGELTTNTEVELNMDNEFVETAASELRTYTKVELNIDNAFVKAAASELSTNIEVELNMVLDDNVQFETTQDNRDCQSPIICWLTQWAVPWHSLQIINHLLIK